MTETPAEALSPPDGTREFVAFAVEYLREFGKTPNVVAAGDRILAQLDRATLQAATRESTGLDVALLARAQAIADGLAGEADELDELDHEYARTVAAEYVRLATAQKETPDD